MRPLKLPHCDKVMVKEEEDPATKPLSELKDALQTYYDRQPSALRESVSFSVNCVKSQANHFDILLLVSKKARGFVNSRMVYFQTRMRRQLVTNL